MTEFPKLDIDDFGGSPEEIAVRVRVLWNLPVGPIRSIMRAIEDAGGIVFRVSFGTKKIDAVSHWPPGMPPLFFVNSDMEDGGRGRLTLAHELGHIIMQNAASIDPEAEANRFAAEFLMPARQIASEFSQFSIPKAARLKPYWKVSMQALARRAHDVKAITPWAYRSFFTEFSRLGYRTKEPIPIRPEEPTLLDAVLKVHFDDFGYTISDMCDAINVFEDEFRSDYLDHGSGKNGLRVIG